MSENQITSPKKTLKDMISSEKMKTQFEAALPKHLSADRFCRVAITALTKTPKLAECNPETFMKCLLDLSALGLEPDGYRAHLIPFRNNRTNSTDCQLIIDYKGIIELVRRSGDIVSIRAEVVCKEDGFEWKNGEITHEVDFRNDRGAFQCVYAEAVMKSGERQTSVMTKSEVEGIQNRSKAGNSGPWQTDFNEMAKKTVVRRLSKMLPISSEIAKHVSIDDTQFDGMRNVTPKGKISGENIFKESLPEPEKEGGDE